LEGDDVTKNILSRLNYYSRFLFSLMQIAAIRGYDLLISLLSRLTEHGRTIAKFLRTSRDHYTVLIVPQKKSMVRKISASSNVLRLMAVVGVIAAICFLYIFYEFLTAKKEIYELYELRKLSVAQQEQIHNMASKIGYFEQKLESLKEYEKKIRSMADMDGVKKGERESYRGVGGPIPDQERSTGSGSETAAIGQMNKSLDQLIYEASQQEKNFQEIIAFLEKRRSILARTPSIWPVEGWVTSGFGVRKSPFSFRKEFHSAIDIAARSGKEVVAPADGIVSEVERRSDMGNMVTLDHGNGITTSYAHLLKSQVHKGKNVRRGEVIGFIGSTGRSTGPHLHYSVHLNGVPVNPRKYLP